MSACRTHLEDAAARPGAAGMPAVLEPLLAGDEATVLEVFDGLGPRSRHQRFLTAKPRLTAADLHALTHVDGHDRVALVARDGSGCAIGIARLVRDRDDPAAAEAAVTVVDAWQGRGVGTRLARALAERARDLGITRILLVMAHDNEAAVRLMHRISGDVTRLGFDSGSVDFEVALETGARPRRHPAPRRTLAVLKGAPA